MPLPASRVLRCAIVFLFTLHYSATHIFVSAQQQSTARILLYTATADFRHDSIPTAIEALKNQSSSGDFNIQFDATEDKSKFSDDNLANYDAIMFVSTTGESKLRHLCLATCLIRNFPFHFSVLDDSGKSAFRSYLDKGGNFIAVHAASDSLRNTTWFGDEVGACP